MEADWEEAYCGQWLLGSFHGLGRFRTGEDKPGEAYFISGSLRMVFVMGKENSSIKKVTFSTMASTLVASGGRMIRKKVLNKLLTPNMIFQLD